MTLVIAFSQQNTDVVKLIRRICSNTSSNTSGDQLAKGSVTTTLDIRQRERQLTSVRSERGMPDVYSQALYTSTETIQGGYSYSQESEAWKVGGVVRIH
jgi:hypothetical protein